MPLSPRTVAALAAVAAWLAAIGVGYGRLLQYAATAGPGVDLPRASRPAATSGRWRLVMFVHPRCPCTRASLGELGRLAARVGDRTDLEVVLVAPDGQRSAVDPGLARLIGALPGVRVRHDNRAEEARRLQASTSGRDGPCTIPAGAPCSRGD